MGSEFMKRKIKKYFEILQIELDDLIVDLEFSKSVLEQRLEKHEITEYVFLENLSLLKKEILGVEELQEILDSSVEELRSIEDIKAVVEDYFQKSIKAAGLPNVVLELVNNKLEKVSKYMAIGE